MKKIEAIIRRSKLNDVKNALTQSGLLHGMTVSEAHGLGGQQGADGTYRGHTYARPFVPRLKLEILSTDDEASAIVDCIFEAAYTGEVGDGKILVSAVERVYRIRTGEVMEEFSVEGMAGAGRLS